MTITVGTGPFGHKPGGEFNIDVPKRGVEYLEPFPRHVRALLDGEVVVDSLDVKLLHVQHSLPVWCFPTDDVRLDRLGEDAWVYEEGLAEGLAGVRWDAVDRWLEEEDEVIAHPRDPYHRIDLRETSRVVAVALDGETLAESSGALALFEASLPSRWYLPPDDVSAELVDNPDVSTACAYKGWASYHDVRVGDRLEPFLAWCYRDPLEEMGRLQGRICFFNERVDLSLDGTLQERPRNLWSRTEWAKDPAATKP
jgi:uncharacterized protein (DUF427 family)